jgi:uncharacterized membrane protein YkvA (DUF1232 family)
MVSSARVFFRRLGWGGFLRFVIHLPSFIKLFTRLMRDSRVPAAVKLVPLGSIGYLILPTDLVPDFLPGLGQLDDLAVIVGGLKLFLRLCPPDVVQQHVQSIAAGK